MKQLMNLKLFSLLTENPKNKSVLTKLESAYEEFAITLFEKLQKEADITKLYYNLSFVRLELAGIRDLSSDVKEKKCLEICD